MDIGNSGELSTSDSKSPTSTECSGGPSLTNANRPTKAVNNDLNQNGIDVKNKHTENDDNNSRRSKKRGMKPRSKRNRKRPRSEVHSLGEDMNHSTQVHRLAIDGKPVQDSAVQWLRTVEPYPYTFSTFAKARWLGRTVLDVYATEFGSYPKSYYESAIEQGRILISDQKVDTSFVIKGGDILTHTVHRHEPAVAVYSKDIPYVPIVQDTPDVLVVDKPGTLPIHPCGGYHVQSLMNLLEPQFGKLYTIHRLDRLTSGLVILGKTSLIAQEWGKAIMNRKCQKVYLARVKGKFPLKCPADWKLAEGISNPPVNGEWQEEGEDVQASQQQPVQREEQGSKKKKNSKNNLSDEDIALFVKDARQRNAHTWWVADDDGEIVNDLTLQSIFDNQRSDKDWLKPLEETTSSSEDSGRFWFHLACPTRIAKPKDGVCEAGPFDELDNVLYHKTVKPAGTSFGVIRYDEATDSTIVVCRPATGRTHQIRLHLQHLGHPIANDPNYGGDMWYANEGGKEACKVAQAKLDAIQQEQRHTTQVPDKPLTEMTKRDARAQQTIDKPATEEEIQKGICQAVQTETESIHDFIKRTCVWCARSGSGGKDRATLEFLIRS
ncbi:MAG: hypothetical protein SGBAC_012037, partial [Bacillariaceae sp.]